MGRGLAALTAVVALIALAGQFVVSTGLMDNPGAGAVIWNMAGYFTVLTNALAAGVLMSAAGGVRVPDWLAGTVASALVVTGVVYHSVLSGLWAPVGMAWWADQGLHTAVPILTLVWWMIAADKRGLTLRTAAAWLIWPLIYLVYALLRQTMTGFVAYPFLDLAGLGAGRVAVNTLIVMALFAGVSGALLGLSRLTEGRAR
jgi:hypothetical protein